MLAKIAGKYVRKRPSNYGRLGFSQNGISRIFDTPNDYI
jgi:hypothetical protein